MIFRLILDVEGRKDLALRSADLLRGSPNEKVLQKTCV